MHTYITLQLYAVVFHSSVNSVIKGVFRATLDLPDDDQLAALNSPPTPALVVPTVVPVLFTNLVVLPLPLLPFKPPSLLLPLPESPDFPRRETAIKTHTQIAATATRTDIVIPAMAPALRVLLLDEEEEEEEPVGMNRACSLLN